MKKLYFLLALVLFAACTSDDDGTNANENIDLNGIWQLAYLTDMESNKWNPELICNGETEMQTEINHNNSLGQIVGNTPCNTFDINNLQLGENSYTGRYAITLAQCQPAYQIPECAMDGNEFEILMWKVLSNRDSLDTDYPVNFEVERFGSRDTLRIINDSLETAVYWRNLN